MSSCPFGTARAPVRQDDTTQPTRFNGGQGGGAPFGDRVKDHTMFDDGQQLSDSAGVPGRGAHVEAPKNRVDEVVDAVEADLEGLGPKPKMTDTAQSARKEPT